MTLALVSPVPMAVGAVSLNGAGATFPYPLYSKWFDAYAKQTGIKINYQSIGSGGGIQQLKARTVDFGASDAPLSDAEMREMPAPVVHIPTVAGAVAVVYNVPGARAGLRLDGPVLADIYLGRIRRWDDKRIAALNPGIRLPGRVIAVVHRSDGSGTTYIFTHYLAAVSPTWRANPGAAKSVNWPAGIGAKGNEGVAGIVQHVPGAIGYVELAYAMQTHLPMAALKNRAGRFVLPGVQSAAAAAAGGVAAMRRDVRVSVVNSPGANAYPITGFTYILAYRHQANTPKGRALVGFLRWAMHEGQRYPASLFYVPLPPAVVALNDKAIASIR